MRLFEQEKPDYLAVAFDTGKTFRDKIYPAYKATRAKMPDDLRAQIERIRQLVDAFNIPRLEMEGYEADDILGTIARQAEEKGLGVKIITGDRDLLQLVTARIIVNLPGSKMADAKDYTPKDVEDFLGVRPDQVVDYKALVGDKSDNIPGVAGIGEKTATALLQTYQTLDEIYANLDKLAQGVRTKLETSKEMAYRSQTLARIVTFAPINLDLENAVTADFDVKKVESIFRELEFRGLMTRLQNMVKVVRPSPTTQQLSLFDTSVPRTDNATAGNLKTVIVDTLPALEELVRKINSVKLLALDTEDHIHRSDDGANWSAFRCAVEAGTAYYIPVGHRLGSKQLPLDTVIDSPGNTVFRIRVFKKPGITSSTMRWY